VAYEAWRKQFRGRTAADSVRVGKNIRSISGATISVHAVTLGVRRMLADPRADALVSNFVGQWLFLRNLPAVLPDPRKDPDFDEDLRQGFRRETEMFAGSIFRENRSVLDLLTANYTFVDEVLARHYGIPKVLGTSFQRVALNDPNRFGLLGQGSILTLTSLANRTSPVLRGKFVLNNILGSPVPPPPQNVPPLKAETAEGTPVTIREALERPEVQALASKLGLDLNRATAAVDTMSGSDLEKAAQSAQQVNDQLVGGASNVVISTTTLIIILLLVIILIVALK